AQLASRGGRAAHSTCGQSPWRLRRHSRRPSWSIGLPRSFPGRQLGCRRKLRKRKGEWKRIGQETQQRSAFRTLCRQGCGKHVASCGRPCSEKSECIF